MGLRPAPVWALAIQNGLAMPRHITVSEKPRRIYGAMTFFFMLFSQASLPAFGLYVFRPTFDYPWATHGSLLDGLNLPRRA